MVENAKGGSELTNVPKGHSLGYIFNIATGRQLDIFGEYEGVTRRRWSFFYEPDFMYKNRIIESAVNKMDKTTQGQVKL